MCVCRRGLKHHIIIYYITPVDFRVRVKVTVRVRITARFSNVAISLYYLPCTSCEPPPGTVSSR